MKQFSLNFTVFFEIFAICLSIVWSIPVFKIKPNQPLKDVGMVFSTSAKKMVYQEKLINENSTYTIIRKRMTQRAAQLFCMNRTDRLATFPRLQDAKRMSLHIQQLSELYTPEYDLKHHAVEFGLDRRYWIGLTDVNVEDEWQWEQTNGTYLRYDYWAPGQPDHINKSRTIAEHCVTFWNPAYYENGRHMYNDEPCINKHYFICEKYIREPSPEAQKPKGRIVEGLGYVIDDENGTLPYGVTLLEFDESNTELCKAVLIELHRRRFDSENSSEPDTENYNMQQLNGTDENDPNDKNENLGKSEKPVEKRDASDHHDDEGEDKFQLRNMTMEEVQEINIKKCRRYPGRSFYGRSFHGHMRNNGTNVTDLMFAEFNASDPFGGVFMPRGPFMGRNFMGRGFLGDSNDLEMTDTNNTLASGRRFLGRSFEGDADHSEISNTESSSGAMRQFGRGLKGHFEKPVTDNHPEINEDGTTAKTNSIREKIEFDDSKILDTVPETTTVSNRKFIGRGRTFEGQPANLEGSTSETPNHHGKTIQSTFESKPDSSEVTNVNEININLQGSQYEGEIDEPEMSSATNQNMAAQKMLGRAFQQQPLDTYTANDASKVNSTNKTKNINTKPGNLTQSTVTNAKTRQTKSGTKEAPGTKSEGTKNIVTFHLPKNKANSKATHTIVKFILP